MAATVAATKDDSNNEIFVPESADVPAPVDTFVSVTEPAVHETEIYNRDQSQPVATDGASLADRVAAADSGPQATEDSLDAIRNDAMHALEEARSINDQQSTVEPVDSDQVEPEVPSRPVAPIDYSPSAPAPKSHSADEDLDEVDDAEQAVESRYSRNSAKLPRLGIEPGSASSTIADLRKQMTAEN